MALPKRRTSRSKRNMRRSHDHLSPPPISICPQCNEPKLPHYACSNCGQYKGREVLKIEE